MTKPSQKNKKLRQIFYRAPSETRVKYKRQVHQTASCAVCGKKLQGVRTSRKLSKTQKKSGRPFSGTLCAACTALSIKQKSRQNVEMRFRKYIGK